MESLTVRRPSIERLFELRRALDSVQAYLADKGATREVCFNDDPKEIFEALAYASAFLSNWAANYYKASSHNAVQATRHPDSI